MRYEHFATIYDQFMYDQPYDKWLEVVQPYLKNNLLDLATGTGAFIALVPPAVHTTGIDISEEMLAVAATKRNDVTFIAQDMTKLELNQTFNTVTCLCDSLNYLPEQTDVEDTFNHVYQHLDDDGVFIFDVHSTHKFDAYFNNQTYSDEQEGMLYVWHAVEGEAPYSVYHDLTFFTEDSDVYHRFDEQHYQRTFTIEAYTQMLTGAGFNVEKVFADFNPDFLVDDDTEQFFERVFFIAKKK